jgi:O-antigen ligase
MRLSSKKSFQSKNSNSQIIIFSGVALTLIFTPWFNKDSLVIPKQILLVSLAAFFLPSVCRNSKKLTKNIFGRIVLVNVVLIFLHLLLVLLFSEAPSEQQIYGRDGRLLGFLTFVSLLVVLISSMSSFSVRELEKISKGIILCGLLTSTYAIFQSFGLDAFEWESRTNKVISTLGNPNYVSAFAAAIAIPLLVYCERLKYKRIFQLISVLFLLLAINRSDSIQGYLALVFAIAIFTFILTFYKSRKLSFAYIVFILPGLVLILIGTLGHGVLAPFLYKNSVQSRGDFWRSALNMATDNPIFGVGLDSLGDNYLTYRDQIAADHTFSEFTDSAHNYILDYAAFGGLPLAFLNISLIILTFGAFVVTQRRLKKINIYFLAQFVSWTSLQLTLLISPMSFPILFWSFVQSAAILGSAIFSEEFEINNSNQPTKKRDTDTYKKVLSISMALLAMFPLFNNDRLFLKSLQTNDGNLGIKVVDRFPKSSNKYSTVSRLLFESGESQYSLEVARKAVGFNRKNITAWALIMVNPLATYDERIKAKKIVLKLDPFNKEVPTYEIKEDK